MEYRKRYLTAKNESGAIIAVSTVIFHDGKTAFKTECGEKTIDAVVVSDGKIFEKHAFNEVIALDIPATDELYVLYIAGKDRYYAKLGDRFENAEKFIEKYEKTTASENYGEAQANEDFFRYDDEKIAEENYYLKASDGKTETLQNARIETQTDALGQIGESGGFPCENDRRPIACGEQEGADDPAEDASKQRRKAFYERGESEKRKSELARLLAENPADEALSAVIPCGRFCRAGDRVVGKIVYGGKTYVCIGKTGRKNSPELRDPAVFFVPRSIFGGDEGYLLSFSLADETEYIEKRFTERKKPAIIDV